MRYHQRILTLGSFPDTRRLGILNLVHVKKTQKQYIIDLVKKQLQLNSMKPSYPSHLYIFFTEAICQDLLKAWKSIHVMKSQKEIE